MTTITIEDAIGSYLKTIQQARSPNTARTYGNALHAFSLVLKEHRLDAGAPVSDLTDEGLIWMLTYLKVYSSSTERLYTQAVKGFYQYLAAENLTQVNIQHLELLIRNRSRRSGQRLPQFPRDNIEQLLSALKNRTIQMSDNPGERLRALRDRAFLLTLADTGLRVHEACGLHRGDLDWNEGRALVIGKGNKQAVVRFSTRCLGAIKDYLALRAQLDGSFGRPLPSLPLFARHDRGAGKKVLPITTTTGRNIVADSARQILGEDSKGKITPHSFRHYFVTTVLRSSGNLKLAQELARHASIQVTQRYAHLSDDELDRGYHEIFEE
jgi:site-specific recombinase XerD